MKVLLILVPKKMKSCYRFFRVKATIPDSIPVGYVDAYYEFSIKPRITAACDLILTNCYP